MATIDNHMPQEAYRPAQVMGAGALYLIIIVAGITSEVVLRGPLIVPGDALQTAARVQDNLGQFRLSIAGDVVMMLADVVLALVLYSLLRPVREGWARAAMVFRLIQAALIGASLLLLAMVPGLAMQGESAMALQMILAHATGYDVGLIFFGINSFLMSALLWSSGGVPRVITAALAGAGIVYITGGFLRVLAPGLTESFEMAYLLPFFAETSLCLWFLIARKI